MDIFLLPCIAPVIVFSGQCNTKMCMLLFLTYTQWCKMSNGRFVTGGRCIWVQIIQLIGCPECPRSLNMIFCHSNDSATSDRIDPFDICAHTVSYVKNIKYNFRVTLPENTITWPMARKKKNVHCAIFSLSLFNYRNKKRLSRVRRDQTVNLPTIPHLRRWALKWRTESGQLIEMEFFMSPPIHISDILAHKNCNRNSVFKSITHKLFIPAFLE